MRRSGAGLGRAETALRSAFVQSTERLLRSGWSTLPLELPATSDPHSAVAATGIIIQLGYSTTLDDAAAATYRLDDRTATERYHGALSSAQHARVIDLQDSGDRQLIRVRKVKFASDTRLVYKPLGSSDVCVIRCII